MQNLQKLISEKTQLQQEFINQQNQLQQQAKQLSNKGNRLSESSDSAQIYKKQIEALETELYEKQEKLKELDEANKDMLTMTDQYKELFEQAETEKQRVLREFEAQSLEYNSLIIERDTLKDKLKLYEQELNQLRIS